MKLFGLLCFLVNGVALKKIPEQNHIFENGPMTDKVEGRIAGGEEVANMSQFPFVAQVTTKYKFCSGVIISENYILTTAYCVRGYDSHPQDIEVRAGSAVRGEGTLIPIVEATEHPQYSGDEYDVAYMRTMAPLVFGEDMEPGVLVSTQAQVPSDFYLTGWGNTTYSDDPPKERPRVLKQVILVYIDQQECRNLEDHVFCAVSAYYTGDEGGCDGDQGSPASLGYFIYGLFSMSSGCGPNMSPSIFTNLQDRWIREFITERTGVEYENHF